MKNKIPVYTEKQSFADKKYDDFYIGSYRDKTAGYFKRIEPHRHTYFEIIWVRKGKGIHTIDFKNYKFEGPCLFLLHPQNIHTIQKQSVTSGGVIKFSPSFFSADDAAENFLLNHGVFDDIDALPVINLTNQQDAALNRLFVELNEEYKRKGSFSGEILVSFLKIFLLKIYEIKKRSIPEKHFRSIEFRRYRSFQQCLDKEFKQHHEVSFYAGFLHVSAKTLSNITHKFAGKSPQNLIKERILLEAKRLIYHSALSIKEIAYSIGFNDYSYFIRFFKKNTGTNPAEHRKLNA